MPRGHARRGPGSPTAPQQVSGVGGASKVGDEFAERARGHVRCRLRLRLGPFSGLSVRIVAVRLRFAPCSSGCSTAPSTPCGGPSTGPTSRGRVATASSTTAPSAATNHHPRVRRARSLPWGGSSSSAPEPRYEDPVSSWRVVTPAPSYGGCCCVAAAAIGRSGTWPPCRLRRISAASAKRSCGSCVTRARSCLRPSPSAAAPPRARAAPGSVDEPARPPSPTTPRTAASRPRTRRAPHPGSTGRSRASPVPQPPVRVTGIEVSRAPGRSWSTPDRWCQWPSRSRSRRA